MEEKRKDLKNSKQRDIIQTIMSELSKSHPSFYYMPTTDVAAEIHSYISHPSNLSFDDKAEMAGLTRRDIQLILSHH